MNKKAIFIGCDYYGEHGLRSILQALKTGPLEKMDVVGLATYTFKNHTNPLIPVAKLLQIPYYEGDLNAPEGIEWVQKLKPDLGIMMEYPKLLKESILKQFALLLNAHPSDLPDLRGGAPIEGTILRQQPLVVTIHIVDSKFDTGNWVKKSDPIHIHGFHFYQVYELAAQIASDLMVEVLQNLLANQLPSYPQDESKSSYLWYKDTEKLLSINWDYDSIQNIHLKILAAGPKRGVKSLVSNPSQNLTIYKGRPFSLSAPLPPGHFLIKDTIPYVSARDGVILLDQYDIS